MAWNNQPIFKKMTLNKCPRISFSITSFAWKSKSPFTFFAPLPFVLGFIVVIVGILAIVFNDSLVNICFATFFAIIFSVYLLLDTVLIINGQAKACYHCHYLDQFILATEALYLDILAIFIYLV